MSELYHINSLSPIPTTAGIYKITCVTTQMFYIGSTSNLRQRHYNHSRDLLRNEHSNSKLQRAFNKYGCETFTFEIIEFVLFPELLTMREQYWLDKLEPWDEKGFNLVRIAGSNLGRKHTPEAREKLRIARTGKKHSEESIQKMKEVHTGHVYGPQARANMSKAQKGRTVSAETRAKQSLTMSGHETSPEAREKLRIAGLGRRMSARSRALADARNAAHMKTIIVTSPEGEESVVHGINQFCREHNLSQSAIIGVAKGRCCQHKGWKARYLDTNIA